MKNKYEQYKRLIMFVLGIMMVGLLSAVYGYVWYKHYLVYLVYPFLGRGNVLLIFVYAVILIILLNVYSGFKFGYLRFADLIFSQVICIVITNVITYFQISLIGRSLASLFPMMIMTLVDLVIVGVWSAFAVFVYHKMYPPHNTLMVYGSEMATSLLRKIKMRPDKYKIKDIVDVNSGLDNVKAHMQGCDAVIICDVKTETRNKILKYCFEESIRTYVTPKISDIIIRGADDIHFFDTPLLLCRNLGLSFEEKLMKRVMDIIISSIILVVGSPFMLITAIAIKMYDGGPVFFKQRRCTINGKEFDILKFRSMIVDAEKPGMVIPATDKDPRITPVGNFIRATRIDELPQLINVLKGEMSIVGPRPERVEHVQKYSEQIPEFAYRLKVKGGLTGYAQIMGKYNTTAYDKLKLDLMYIENYSIMMDIKLLLMTIKIVFMKESTEGFEVEEQAENKKEF